MTRTRAALLFAGVPALLGLSVLAGVWGSSSLLISPPWQERGLSRCSKGGFRFESWGPDCGNLAVNRRLRYLDFKVPSPRGHELPGWYVPSAANLGRDASLERAAETALVFVHGGGADRREGFRFLDYFLGHGVDVYLFDYSCHGDAPCPVQGLSFGEREHRDVVDVIRYAKGRHRRVFAMGTSVGATSILMALPHVEPLDGVIAENPMHSYERFVRESPAAPSFLPGWFRSLSFRASLHRGGFSGTLSAAAALREAAGQTPILFLHSRADGIIPSSHSEDLHREYRGPKRLVVFDTGEHADLWKTHEAEMRSAIDEILR